MLVNRALTLILLYSPLQFAVPHLHCSLAHVEGQTISDDTDKPTQLASFLQGALHLAVSTLLQLLMQQQYEDTHLLPTLTMNLLLLVQTLVQGELTFTHIRYTYRANTTPCCSHSGSYRSLSASLGSLPPHPSLNEIFFRLTASHPLLTLHYISVLLCTKSSDLQWVSVLCTIAPLCSLISLHRFRIFHRWLIAAMSSVMNIFSRAFLGLLQQSP